MKRCFRGDKILSLRVFLKAVINVLLPFFCLKNPKPVSVVIANENKSKKDTIDLKSFFIVKVSTEIKKLLVLILLLFGINLILFRF